MENESPTCIAPSMSEVQIISFEIPPSSGSVADPSNVIRVLSIKLEPPTGLVIDNVGVSPKSTVYVND